MRLQISAGLFQSARKLDFNVYISDIQLLSLGLTFATRRAVILLIAMDEKKKIYICIIENDKLISSKILKRNYIYSTGYLLLIAASYGF